MVHFDQVIAKRWIPILLEYEKVKNKEKYGRVFYSMATGHIWKKKGAAQVCKSKATSMDLLDCPKGSTRVYYEHMKEKIKGEDIKHC